MFARCASPVWRRDDFTSCFKQDFLQSLFPLIACGVSALCLLLQFIRRTWKIWRKNGYTSLRSTTSGPKDLDVDVNEEQGNNAAILDGGAEHTRLTLQKTVSATGVPFIEISRPRGAKVLVVVEILALLGLIGTHLEAVLTDTWRHNRKNASILSVCVWCYILLLTLSRLLPPRLSTYPLPKLWNHTTSLYCLQWLCITILFRSALIHPSSPLAQALSVVDFVLASLLAIVAITTRKGNRVVLSKYEDNLEPSHEPLASLLSLVTFSWVDSLVWKGYWKTLETTDVWSLLPSDKAANVLGRYRQLKKTSKLAWHLMKHFKSLLLLQQCWAVLSALLTFAPTLLLRAILQYLEDPLDTPAATAWLLVMSLAFVGIVSGIASGQDLWIGRRLCIRLRAILVAEIYAKTLRRKATITTESDIAEEEKKASEKSGTRPGLKQRMLCLFRKKTAQTTSLGTENSVGGKAIVHAQMNTGAIINLMSVDSFKVSEICAYLHFLFPTVPIQLVVAMILLYQILGWSSIASIGIMFCLSPLNVWISSQFAARQKKIMSAIDGRIHTTNEVLQNVRIIKYFAWEQRFAQNVNEKRTIELRALRSKFMVWGLAASVWHGAPILITASSFFLYTIVEKKPLIPSIAFTALSLFSILRYPLDKLADMTAHILESKVSVDRVEQFLNEEETGKYDQLSSARDEAGERETVGFDNATFTWAGEDALLGAETTAFRMINLDIKFHMGGLNVVIGSTGSGKTSLLMALLGEMTILHGKVHLPGGSREGLVADPATGLTESVAFCAQQAWLINDTVKQNILFASPYDESRYKSVIEACALTRDLEVLDAGDATLVGEKGIVVSGGQKQRISLARALYCNSRYILLDDCLSAVDSHTAQHIFEQCILGSLMLNRTCILVTHNISLCVPRSQFVVVLANGKVTAQGSAQDVMSSGVLGEDLLSSMPPSQAGTHPPSRSRSAVDLRDNSFADCNSNNSNPGKVNGHGNSVTINSKQKQQVAEDKDANIRTESKAEGAVDWRVIKLYTTSMGGVIIWGGVLATFALENVFRVSMSLWIRRWANSYSIEDVHIQGSTMFSMDNASYPAAIHWLGLSGHSIPFTSSSGSLSTTSAAEVDVGYYIGIYTLLGLLFVLGSILNLGVVFKGSLNASRTLHAQLLEAVLRAKFKFFDTTPLGQIMNRFSKDLQSIDQDVSIVAAGMLQGLFSLTATVIIISVITPGFLIAGIFLTGVYFCIAMFYVRSSRDLKRIESVQKAPLFQQFGETLSGITTIRAYGDEQRFIRDNYTRINTHNRPYIYLWAANRWLALRVDWAGAFVSFFAGVFIMANANKIDAGAAGLSLTYALTFNENILWLVRLYADNEQNMNHVERLKNYLELEQEAKALIPENKPPGNWPSRGTLEFLNYSTRYRIDLEQVLKHLNLKIEAEEKVGIVGRTGAGKSSLAMAIFRGLEAEEGKILIDGVNIGLIGLQDLRENITIVPQDPTLFTGTIRSNLDPFGLFTDEEVFTSLRRVYLIGAATSSPSSPVQPVEEDTTPAPQATTIATLSNTDSDTANTLSKNLTNSHENTNIFVNLLSPVAESGSNLSQGQRQLLCLARALLKSPRILLMDEATASIDYATDAKVQDTLRELKGSTVITIAHRLQTIIDYDKVLVLDKGEVIEFDAPWVLIEKEDGIFRGMCEMTGDFEALIESARKAERKGKLVDV